MAARLFQSPAWRAFHNEEQVQHSVLGRDGLGPEIKGCIKIMNTKPKLKIQPAQPITIELATELVTAIVADYFNRRFNAEIPIQDEHQILANSLQEQIVREHLATGTKPLDRQANGALARNIKRSAKKPSKCPNNPKPRAERLTNAYVGNPADFETTPASISVQVQNTIHQVLSMSSVDRVKRYSGPLRLHAYNHKTYKWFATLCKRVSGTPIRRFFPDLQGAVTWLEVVRDRWLTANLKSNLPLGGVSRHGFQMPWQSQTTGSGDVRHKHAPKMPAGTQNNPRKSPWTAERRAELSARLRDKQAYHSVPQLKQKKRTRPCATKAQILAGVYIPMPGNNVATALNAGSTAAVVSTPETE